MFRHLLVPLDGSPLAEAALPITVTVAGRFDARVTLLHIQEPRPPATVHGTPHLRRPTDAEAYLATLQAWFAERGIPAAAHVHEPGIDVSAGIAGHAVELGADLIVLCAHGAHRLRTLLVGARARRVLTAGTAPVLLVRPVPDPRHAVATLARVLVALDGEPAHETALEPAAALAAEALYLLRVVPTGATLPGSAGASGLLLPRAARELLDTEVEEAVRYLERIDARAQDSAPAVHSFVGRGDPTTEILACAHREAVDLVAVATHGRRGMAAAWEGSVPWRLVEAGGGALLLVQAP